MILVARMIVLQVAILGGDVYLRRILDPSDFGTFAIAQFALAFFAHFGDAGLGAGLIQKADEPSHEALSTIWTFQMALSIVIALVVGLGAPYILLIWPDVSPHAVWLLRALSLDLILTAARAVPTMLMERHLQYGRLAVIEVLITVPFYAVAIALARMGWGVMALVAAVLVQGSCGVIGAFAMRPWRPSLIFNWREIRPVLKFGAQYQLNNVIGFLLGAIMPVYAGHVLGQRQLAFLDWSQRTAYFPLKLVEVMSRISFPLYSRLQDDRKLFTAAVERSLQICAMGTLFFVGLIFALGPNIVAIVYSEKWLPALPTLYVYAAGISFGFLTPVIAPVLNATARPHVNVRFSVGWTIATMMIVPFTTARWGAFGFAVGYCIPMIIGNLGMILVVKSLVPDARLWPRTRASLIGGLVVALVGHYALATRITEALTLVGGVAALLVLFVVVVTVLDRSAAAQVISLARTRRQADVDGARD